MHLLGTNDSSDRVYCRTYASSNNMSFGLAGKRQARDPESQYKCLQDHNANVTQYAVDVALSRLQQQSDTPPKRPLYVSTTSLNTPKCQNVRLRDPYYPRIIPTIP